MTITGPALVTGASGFIGRHLVRALLAQGRPVFALCRHPTDLEDMVHPLLELVVGRLDQVHAFASTLAEGVSVFHLAAARNAPGEPHDLFRRVNEVATVELGRAAARRGVTRFVHVSTALVFGPSQGGCVAEDGVRHWKASESCYLLSKVRAQEEILGLVGQGLPLVVVCPTIVFGPDHPSHPNRLTAQMRRLLRSRLDMVIDGGHQRRNLVYVDDVVQGILLAEARGGVGEIYILGGQDCSHLEFNRGVFSLSGVKPRLRLSLPGGIVEVLSRAADGLRGFHPGAGYGAALRMLKCEWRYSSRKAELLLGYTARPVGEGIQQTLAAIAKETQLG